MYLKDYIEELKSIYDAHGDLLVVQCQDDPEGYHDYLIVDHLPEVGHYSSESLHFIDRDFAALRQETVTVNAVKVN